MRSFDKKEPKAPTTTTLFLGTGFITAGVFLLGNDKFTSNSRILYPGLCGWLSASYYAATVKASSESNWQKKLGLNKQTGGLCLAVGGAAFAMGGLLAKPVRQGLFQQFF